MTPTDDEQYRAERDAQAENVKLGQPGLYERAIAYVNYQEGADWATQYWHKRMVPVEVVEKLVEALEMGAFHHSSCNANFYEDGSTRSDWNGYGDHRAAKPCTCAHYKVDFALAEFEKYKGGGK